jgi:eukaryotic-like serine/threonine-protein kinase
LTPSKIGRYEIQRELGRGMMGVVYEARDPSLNRTIALKVVRLVFAVSDKERDNFERRFLVEARVAARLSHPGIVVVHDIDRDAESGLLYIALEYLEGRTLAQILNDEGLLPWPEALRVVREVAEALHYAHGRGVVHRDIKPANIMVLPGGDVKIMDFGLAKHEMGHELTASGQLVGTPLFMAPEQVSGKPVDGRTEIFSLGSVTYTLLTGRRPFAADSVPRIMAKVVHQEPPRPSSIRADLPESLDYLVARAMAKAPDERYPHGKAMAEDAADVLAGRVPRHQKSWTPPEHGASTIVSAADDEVSDLLAGQLEEVDDSGAPMPPVSPEERPAAPPRTSPSPLRLLTLGMLLVGLTAYYLSIESPERLARLAGFVGPAAAPDAGGEATAPERAEETPSPALVAAGLPPADPVGAAEAAGAADETPSASPSPSPESSPVGPVPETEAGANPQASPVPSEAESPPRPATAAFSPAPSSESGVPAASPSRPSPLPKTPTGPMGRLSVRIEHQFKKASIRLWVDDRLVLDQALDSRTTRRALFFTERKGVVQETLKVTPGRHELRIQLKWDHNVETRRITARFRAGATRKLEIVAGGGKVSLAWD